MITIYDSILKKIQSDILSYGGELQAPATELEIQTLQDQVKNELGVNIPEKYLTLLTRNNGLDYNGTVFYATSRKLIAGYNDRYIEGIISGNLIARDVEEMERFLIFGESDDLLHVLYLPEKKYQTIESIGNSICAEYDLFETMIKNILEDAF